MAYEQDIIFRIWDALRADLNDRGQTAQEIAAAAGCSEAEAEEILNDDPDIALTGTRDGQDLYISVAHLDPQGWTEW